MVGVVCEVVVVEAGERALLVRIGGAGRAGEGKEPPVAVAHEGADVVDAALGHAAGGKCVVGCQPEVLQRVEEGSVQVEDHCAIAHHITPMADCHSRRKPHDGIAAYHVAGEVRQ